jgi:hypothetical protein
MNYFQILPLDIINILLYKLEFYEFNNFIKVYNHDFNYNYILKLRYSTDYNNIIKEFDKINYTEYNAILSTYKIHKFIRSIEIYKRNRKIIRVLMPLNFKDLYNLVEINFGFCNMKKIPDELGYLINLTSLKLSCNSLYTVNECIYKLACCACMLI